jgi:putative transposase
LLCYRYIELNPVRVEMVTYPEEYRWSSYHANALGKESNLRTPHHEYLNLGATTVERLNAYRELFRYGVEPEFLDAIRSSVNKGLAFGENRFKIQIEENFKRRVTPMKMGRPKKSLL